MTVFVESPLGGNLGTSTASFFKLDPVTFTAPIEPVVDLVPGVTPLRITMDMVDSETLQLDYDVTKNSLQDFTDVASNVRRRLRRVSVTGTLSRLAPLTPLGVPPPPTPPGVQLDLLRARNLQALADARLPIMFVSPRTSLARAFIESYSQPWSPDNGESLVVTLQLIEARLVSPVTGAPAQDYPAQTPGNNATTGGGQQASKTVETQTPTAPTAPGNAPGVKAA